MRGIQKELLLACAGLALVLGCRVQEAKDQKSIDKSASSGGAYLRLAQTIPLDGVEGRIDHLSFDPEGARLFVAALGNNSVEVVDLHKGERVKSIKGFAEPQGVSYLPDFKKLYVASGGDGTVKVYDGDSLELASTVKLSGDADNVRYDSNEKRVYVGYGDGAVASIDVTTVKLTGVVKLEAHPESFQLERSGQFIYANVPGKGQIAVINRRSGTVTAKWPLEGAKANFPMALDEADHLLFVGCRSPARMLVYDTARGKQIASVPITGDTDDVFYDAEKKRLYVSGGEGSISVIKQNAPDRYESVAKIATAPGARTSFFIPELHRLYVAVPHRGEQKAGLLVYEVQ